ncbi:hypothetical protein B0H15DRAFT_610887 [Mycena belliarum]|uniref:Uncharacterized protein n=1 Tax=Mycena belliarum TaxID=1033014 RepID=A0AAD6XJV2_9AGAR|nr:hypothetical protein B0H15DRAFT_610887 [Mycena belliae]
MRNVYKRLTFTASFSFLPLPPTTISSHIRPSQAQASRPQARRPQVGTPFYFYRILVGIIVCWADHHLVCASIRRPAYQSSTAPVGRSAGGLCSCARSFCLRRSLYNYAWPYGFSPGTFTPGQGITAPRECLPGSRNSWESTHSLCSVLKTLDQY